MTCHHTLAARTARCLPGLSCVLNLNSEYRFVRNVSFDWVDDRYVLLRAWS